VKLYAATDSLSKVLEFFRLCQRLTSSQGCADFDSVCDDVRLGEEERSNLRFTAGKGNRFQWLDDERRWLFVPSAPRNRLSNAVMKVLSVCQEIGLSDLRKAVSRWRRLEVVPPEAVLGQFIERHHLGAICGTRVVASSKFSDAIEAGSTEDIMVSVLQAHGPVLGGQRFQELCVSAGMNPTTFNIYLSTSPVVTRLARGIYSYVGANIPPGLVEEVAKDIATAH
jgi:hypothetical protein